MLRYGKLLAQSNVYIMADNIKLNELVKHKKTNKVYKVTDSAVEKFNGEYIPVYDCYPIRNVYNYLNGKVQSIKGRTFRRDEITKDIKGGIIA